MENKCHLFYNEIFCYEHNQAEIRDNFTVECVFGHLFIPLSVCLSVCHALSCPLSVGDRCSLALIIMLIIPENAQIKISQCQN